MIKKIKTKNVQQTQILATKLASCLKGGEILFFSGPIGAGKTVMVKEIAKNFGFKKRPVSASFSLFKKYKNKEITIYHADLFRLKTEEMFNLGFEEMLEDPLAILLIEWPEAAKTFFPKDRLDIYVNLFAGDSREIVFKTSGPSSLKLLGDLCKKIK